MNASVGKFEICAFLQLHDFLFVCFLGERGERADVVEDSVVFGAQGERGQHFEGRRCRSAVSRGAGKVPHHGRVQTKTKCLPQIHGQVLGHRRHIQQGPVGSRGRHSNPFIFKSEFGKDFINC